MRKKYIIISILTIVVVLSILAFKIGNQREDKIPSVDEPKTQTQTKQDIPMPDNNEASKYTIDNQSSIYYIVNKQRGLPNTFVPSNLSGVGNNEQMRSEAAQALNTLIATAKNNGYKLKAISGYRSYSYQSQVYSSYVKNDGQAKADTYSARPGHSEHQTGLAADLGTGNCDLQICFGDTSAGKWLAEHAAEFGFIVRYQKGKENLTGYQYEPWHIRYVGIDLAGQIYKSGKTMEQFFNLPAATSY